MANSDYGSDVDFDGDEALSAIVHALEPNPIATRALESESLVEEYNAHSKCVAHVPRSSQGRTIAAQQATRDLVASQEANGTWMSTEPPVDRRWPPTEADADPEALETFARRTPDASRDEATAAPTDPPAQEIPEQDDIRSPLERFRTAPRKPLSVTDIVSPAWCELQYWYALTKFGKKQRTPAMRQGSAVHRALEEQVHTIVPVTVQTKEDGWALRLWNVIQGLRTLRATGMTRELEVWGFLDGQVVNGVIDEISCDCADPMFEAEIEARRAAQVGAPAVPADQQTLEQFFTSQQKSGRLEDTLTSPPQRQRIYLTDVKTRTRPTLPTQAAMRPTMMQLMLYRSLFASLAANTVPADAIFNRYGIDSTASFTEGFIQEVGNLDFSAAENSGVGTGSPVAASSQSHVVQELQQHHNLQLLWQLMIQEYFNTVTSQDMISDILCARFVQASDGALIGIKCFGFEQEALDQYVQREMQWWKGRRPPEGVDVEEAYKCRICEFAEECTWRKDKVDEAVGRHRERRRRTTSGLGPASTRIESEGL